MSLVGHVQRKGNQYTQFQNRLLSPTHKQTVPTGPTEDSEDCVELKVGRGDAISVLVSSVWQHQQCLLPEKKSSCRSREFSVCEQREAESRRENERVMITQLSKHKVKRMQLAAVGGWDC